MTTTAHPARASWRVLLLAALTAVLALLLPSVPASAAALPAAETRVGASGPATTVAVGVHECITAGQRPVRGPSQLQVVVGNCVAAEAGGAGWRLGDDVLAPTSAGNSPAWSTVRGRHWKNTAADPKLAGQWDEANLARMQSGRAPQRFNPDKGGMESMELSHEPIPFRNGGTSFVPRWPQDHAAVDPFRRPGY